MSARGHHGLLLAGGSEFAALMASLAPASWLRLNDNAANNTVIDSSSSHINGSLFEVLTTPTQNPVNTNTRASAGLLSGDSDGCFNFNGSSTVTVPNITLSNGTGWVAFCIMYPASAPATANNTIGAVLHLGGSGDSNGAPELDLADKKDGTFRFRVMRSGVVELAMTALPSWPWQTKLAVALKKEANGNIKLFVNGTLVATSTAAPSFTYGSAVMRWGSARFNSVPWYQFPGLMDELAIFTAPLSDATCQQLTALAAA